MAFYRGLLYLINDFTKNLKPVKYMVNTIHVPYSWQLSYLSQGPLTQKCAHVKCYKEVSLICERNSTISLKQTADNMNRIFHGRKGFLQVRTSSLFLLFILSEQNKKLKKMFN